MHTRAAALAANPFAMLLDLDQVVREVEHSERLNRLHSRVYRPLDKPQLGSKAEADKKASAEFDRLIDEALEVEPEVEPDMLADAAAQEELPAQ
ncbi:MAG: hypothetical protein ABW005_03995 [Burkholderiaceae bacterium]